MILKDHDDLRSWEWRVGGDDHDDYDDHDDGDDHDDYDDHDDNDDHDNLHSKEWRAGGWVGGGWQTRLQKENGLPWVFQIQLSICSQDGIYFWILAIQ